MNSKRGVLSLHRRLSVFRPKTLLSLYQRSIKLYFSLLAHYLLRRKKILFLLSGMFLANMTLQLVSPLVLQKFIDMAISQQPLRILIFTALVFIAFTLMSQVLNVWSNYWGTNIGWQATNELRIDLLRHCFILPLRFYSTHTPGEMIERIDGDTSKMATFFTQFTLQIVGNLLLLMGIIFILLCIDWRVGLGLGCFVLLAFIAFFTIRRKAQPLWRQQRQASADIYGFLEEHLAGTEDIRTNGATPYTLRSFALWLRAYYRATRRAGLATALLINTSVLFITVGTGVAFTIGTILFIRHVFSFSTVYLIYYYTAMLVRPIDAITQQFDDLQNIGACSQRVQEILQTPAEMFEGSKLLDLEGPVQVRFEHVSFSYTPGVPVLHDLTFTLPAGHRLGILGRTGSGKTTITNLLLRFYRPDGGTIYFADQDIETLQLDAFRQSIAIVTQDVHLFNATIRDNLTFFDSSLPDSLVQEALHLMGLDEWLKTQPAGLDTMLESGGGGLSAGQAQLLAFTRVFLRNPKIVILDEASSRLDLATTRKLEMAMETLLKGRTAIIIAHRLMTLARADDILLLEDGRIQEFGSREDLLTQSDSRFAQLMRSEVKEVLL
jgi:ATP-binding cassette subfamily B protein